MRRLLLVAALGAITVACGGGGGTSSPGSPPTEVRVTLADYAFSPDTVTVAAGSEVTITVANTGEYTHNWVVLSEGPMITAEDAQNEDGVFINLLDVVTDRVVVNVLTGSQAEQQETFLAPPVGTYQVICTVARHLGFGMEGTLVVEG